MQGCPMSEEMPFEFTVCWGGAVRDRDVLFSLSGDRGVQGWQEWPGAPNQVKVVGTETQRHFHSIPRVL